jgi:16S rRNA processing protein RimM
VRGWVRVYSYTRPRDNILRYNPWYIQRGGSWEEWPLAEGGQHGKGVIARLESCDDRDQARALMGCEIGIRRAQLPAAAPGEYYWSDLQGMKVVTLEGESLGTVDHLFETGANDVLVVKGERERLIPFVLNQVVVAVDLEAGEIRVDWDKDF